MSSSRRSSYDNHSPSFSSTLLDRIYRSFDDHHHSTSYDLDDVGHWMNKQTNKVRRSSLPEGTLRPIQLRRQVNYSSSSDSCTSSRAFGFSSSSSDSTESRYRKKPTPNKKKKEFGKQFHQRALELYDDIKKPISPGGKLAKFFNSMFNSNALRKPKQSRPVETPSSNQNRSVRFAVEEQRRQVTRNSDRRVEEARKIELLRNYHNQNNNYKKPKVDFLSAHHNHDQNNIMKESKVDFLSAQHNPNHHNRHQLDDVDEDDGTSCCSSDLFELENWLDIDGAYREELPVYETTRFVSNRPIPI